MHNMAKRKPADLNLLLAVDKPLGCTSHDVVAKVRRVMSAGWVMQELLTLWLRGS